jgi:hypothetical protein
MNKRRRDKNYFRGALKRERSRKPAPTDRSAAKIIFSRGTCLFLGWIAIIREIFSLGEDSISKKS